jgi:cytochrome P450
MTAVRYSPYDYEIHEDPYPTYARLRAEAPLYRNDELDFWALSRHHDVAAAFRDSNRFSSGYGVTLDAMAWGPDAYKAMSFLALDPPRHTRMRALVARGFTPRRVQDLVPRIERLTAEYLAPALERGTFDWVADFAGKLPMDVISELLGVPVADRDEVRRQADLLVHREEGVEDVPTAGIEAAFWLAGYYADMVAERRLRPTEDLTSALLDAEVDDERLTDDEIIGFLFLLVVAGNETTTKLLANALYWAARNPGTTDEIWADPTLIPGWIEETLRYDTSTQMLARRATIDIETPHGTIPEGDRVILLVGSANRDPEAFPEADRYDIHRDTSGAIDTEKLSFGLGRHYCMGASLARLEASIALAAFVDATTGYEVHTDDVRRVHSVNVRGFASVPLTVTC